MINGNERARRARLQRPLPALSSAARASLAAAASAHVYELRTGCSSEAQSNKRTFDCAIGRRFAACTIGAAAQTDSYADLGHTRHETAAAAASNARARCLPARSRHFRSAGEIFLRAAGLYILVLVLSRRVGQYADWRACFRSPARRANKCYHYFALIIIFYVCACPCPPLAALAHRKCDVDRGEWWPRRRSEL